MCWVAFDRALRLALKRSLSGPLDVWQRTRDEIRNDIFTNFWDNELQSFVQAKGTKDLDASALLMPMMRFISPVDPMWLSTMRAIENHLIEDTLVRRYEVDRTHVDGLPGHRRKLHRLLVSGMSNVWLAPVSWKRRSCCLKNCSDMPITLGCIQKSSEQTAGTSATFPRRLRISR